MSTTTVSLSNKVRIWNLCKLAATIHSGPATPSATYTLAVARLLFGTAAQESNLLWERQLGMALHETSGGFSKWQLEAPSIAYSLRILRANTNIAEQTTRILFRERNTSLAWPQSTVPQNIMFAMQIIDNDLLGAVFARLHYLQIGELVPLTLNEQAVYWKKHYNTELGKGTTAQYMQNYAELCEETVRLDPTY